MMGAVFRRLPAVPGDPSPSFLLRQVLREEGDRGERPELGQCSWKPQLVHCDGGRRANYSQRGMSGWREGGRVSPRSCRGGTASCGLLAWLPARPPRSPSSPSPAPPAPAAGRPPSPIPALRLGVGRGRSAKRERERKGGMKVMLQTERWRKNLGNE